MRAGGAPAAIFRRGWKTGAHIARGAPALGPGGRGSSPRGLGLGFTGELSSNKYNGDGEHRHEIKYVRKICAGTAYRELKKATWIGGRGRAPTTMNLEGVENREYVCCSQGSGLAIAPASLMEPGIYCAALNGGSSESGEREQNI